MKAYNDYYVYTYSTPPTDPHGSEKVFYVGLGRVGRAYSHVVDDEHDAVVVRIVQRNMNAQEAMRLEAQLIDSTPNLKNRNKAIRYVLQNGEGKMFHVSNLSKFCKVFGLDYGYMTDVIARRKAEYKGWIGVKTDRDYQTIPAEDRYTPTT